MLNKLVQPKWLGALALATLFALACYFLGQWQWSRYEAKAERNATLDRNYRAEPVRFGDTVDQSGIRAGSDWARVTLEGSYETEQVFVRNRPNDGVYGYEILALLQTADDGWVVVNRGWIQNSPEGAAVLPEVSPPPPGTIAVTGWVRPYERSLGRDLPAGQVASIAQADLVSATGADLAVAYVRMELEIGPEGPVSSTLSPLETPDRSLGPHQAYAIQWWLTMALGYAFVYLGARRELREEEVARDPAAAAAAAAEKRARRTKVSRWDEDDS